MQKLRVCLILGVKNRVFFKNPRVSGIHVDFPQNAVFGQKVRFLPFFGPFLAIFGPFLAIFDHFLAFFAHFCPFVKRAKNEVFLEIFINIEELDKEIKFS